MFNRKFQSLLCLVIISLITATGAQAHTALAKSEPADGAMISTSPESLNFGFTESVRLLRVALTMGTTEVDIEFTPTSKAATAFDIVLPSLEHGSYTVNWAALGDDGHRVEGNFSFMLGMNHGNHSAHGNNAAHEH